MLINIQIPNTETPKYMKQIQTDIKGEIYTNTIIEGEFNTSLTSITDHPDRKSIKSQWS